MDLRPGTLVAGRYRVERKVGTGGMGEVWAGEHVAIGVKVALKKLLPAAAVDHQIVARFKREAYLLGRIKSDHVARVVDFIADNRFGLVLVMDFIEGELLADMLEQRRLSVEETLELGVDIAEALCDLSRANIVHRDLKPDNIIMEPRESGRRRAVLVDLGVSRLLSGDGDRDEDITGITNADMAVGTIAYMAPEQLLSSRDVTSASDVYALGAILYRAAAGQHVFGDVDDLDYATKKLSADAEPLALPRIDRVARGLQEVVRRALERQPEARFESAAAMAAELTALRDIARAMALDLEATTEEADPVSAASMPTPRAIVRSTAPTAPRIKAIAAPTLVSAALKPAPLPNFEAISAPEAEAESMFDEVTKLALKGELGELPPLAPSSHPPPSEMALHISEAPKPAANIAAKVEIDPTAVPRWKLIAAVFVALWGGLILGFVLHWGVGGAQPTPPPSASAPNRR